MRTGEKIIFWASTIGIVVILVIAMMNLAERKIEKKVEEQGGIFLSMDSSFSKDESPYKWHERTGKGITVFKFRYEYEGEEYVGWWNSGHIRSRFVWGHKEEKE